MAYKAKKTISMGGVTFMKGHLFTPGSKGFDSIKREDVAAGLVEEIADTPDQVATRPYSDPTRSPSYRPLKKPKATEAEAA